MCRDELEKDSFIVRQSETQLGFCLENLCVPTPENLLRAFVTVSHRWGLWQDEAVNRVCSPLISEEETVGWHHQLNARESGQTLGDGKGQGSLVRCSPWGCKESDTTKLRWPGLLILMSFSGLFNLASGEFLAAPPMISNCWNPAFGTQGRLGKLESCLKERGEKGLSAWEIHRALHAFRSLVLFSLHINHVWRYFPFELNLLLLDW